MSTPTPTAAQAFLAMIESDLVSAGGQPLLTLITQLIADKGNGPKEAADILQFLAAAPGAGVTFIQEIQVQLLTLASTKLNAWIAAHPAA